MSEPLIVTIPHRLGKEEALRRVKPALGKASSSFPVLSVEEEVWSGDRMSFRVRAMGQVAAGSVDVGEDSVRLEVTLPWLLHKFAQALQKTVAGRGRILLEKK
jgi:Putative polyhydroxyalkanoic acid system protein (PHA_gran_rgn)